MGSAKSPAVLSLLVSIALAALPAFIPEASGATFTVTNLNDSGLGSLRQAILYANNNPGADIIEFDPTLSGTITLQSPLPQIAEAVVIDGSTAGGPITIDGSTYNVEHAFTITVWWGTTEIISLRLTGFTEYGVIVTQSLDNVRLYGLDISGCGYGGILIIKYGWGSPLFNVVIENSEIHDNRGAGIGVRASGVTILNSRIYQNGGAGVLITADGEDYPITGPLLTASEIYGNGAEGVLIIGGVSGSRIGVGNIIERNRSGGVTITSDVNGAPSGNYVESNRISFNDYQDVALVGEGVENNRIAGNYITSDELSIVSLGLDIRDGADNNVIEYNIISNHRYEGIAVIGPGTNNNILRGNRVGAFDQTGNPTGTRLDGNGAGILVANDAAPAINYPFPVYGSARLGPDQTRLEENWVLGNRGAGIILIRTTNVVATGNTVEDNELWGYYWVGSTGEAVNSLVEGNGLDGFRTEPYYGASAYPDQPGTDDDVLPEIASLRGTTILNNGGYGIRLVDHPRPSGLDTPLTISGNTLGDVGHFWLGYGRALDESGNPLPGRTIELLRNDGDEVADYVWSSSDSEGRYGPAGFNYDDISTWELIVEYEVGEDGVTRFYNPYSLRLDGINRGETYSWDGRYPDPPGESGGAIESPPTSGVYRYQYALLTIRLPRLVGGEVEPAPLIRAGESQQMGFEFSALFAATLGLALAATAALLMTRRRR